MVVKVFSFQKTTPSKEMISVASLLVFLPKDLPSIVSENWSLVSEKPGKCRNFFYPNEWQPYFSMSFKSDLF